MCVTHRLSSSPASLDPTSTQAWSVCADTDQGTVSWALTSKPQTEGPCWKYVTCVCSLCSWLCTNTCWSDGSGWASFLSSQLNLWLVKEFTGIGSAFEYASFPPSWSLPPKTRFRCWDAGTSVNPSRCWKLMCWAFSSFLQSCILWVKIQPWASLVVKNLLANARDTSLIPGPGRSHMLWSS